MRGNEEWGGNCPEDEGRNPWFAATLLLPLGLVIPVVTEFIACAPFGVAWVLAGLAAIALAVALA